MLALSACSDGRGSQPALWTAHAGGDPPRRILAEHWDTIAAHLGGEQDTLLLYPHRIAAHPGGVYVYDDGARRLISFDRDLCVRAVAGRRGGGPGEFGFIRDLAVTPSGDAALLDPPNGRVTTISPDGALRTMTPLRGVEGAEQLVYLGPERVLILSTSTPRSPFVVLDASGEPLDRLTFPWRGFANLSPLSSNGRLAGTSDGSGTWAFAFGYGNGWFAFDGTRERAFRGRFVEHTEFPVPMVSRDRIELPPAPSSAVSVAIRDSVLYVLFGGSGSDVLRFVDLHALTNGEYLGSYRLPRRAIAIAPSEDGLYVLFPNPMPSLYLLRPRPTDERSAPGTGASSGGPRACPAGV